MYRLTVQGNTVKLFRSSLTPYQCMRCVRGAVTSWSSRSRRRLLDRLNTITFSQAVFATLTYHANVTDINVTRKHWHAMVTHMTRRGLCGIWVREQQRRGAYHYHVLVLDSAREQVEGVMRYWHSLVEPGDTAHEKYGVHIQDVFRPSTAVAYIAKYATKSRDTPGLGRRWGQFGRVPLATQWEVSLNDDAATSIISYLQAAYGVTVYKDAVSHAVISYTGRLGSTTTATVVRLQDLIKNDVLLPLQ